MKNESKSDDLENMDSSPHPETFVIINCVLNVSLMLIWCWPPYCELVRFVQYRPSFSCAVSLSQTCLSGLLFNGSTLHANALISDNSLSQERNLLFLYCLVYALTAISVDRFLALRYHMRDMYFHIMTTKRAVYTSAGLWFVCTLLSCLSSWNSTSVS